MQSAEEFARRLRYREIEEQWDGENETYVDVGFGLSDQDAIDEVAARDAEWQARVDTLLEDNARSEEQVKKQFANAVSFKARSEKAEAQEEKLKAALKNLLYTAEKLWDDAKPIKDSEIVRATHPIIEQARAALGR